MDVYSGFAAVYDMFMDNIPYDEWCACLRGCLEERGIRDGLVLVRGGYPLFAAGYAGI